MSAYTRSNGTDTVFVLDTSFSMKGDGITELKRACNIFINEVEKIGRDHGLSENIAVVEFGRCCRLVCPLTNNYTLVRNAVSSLDVGGDCTPTAEALTIALKEILEHGGCVRVGTCKITPRILLITDGVPTEPGAKAPGVRYPRAIASDDAKNQAMMAAWAFGPQGRVRVGLPYPVPICCVGVGARLDHTTLKQLATLSGGMYAAVENVSELASLFLQQVYLILFLMKHQHDREQLRSQHALRRFFNDLGQGVGDAEAAVLLLFILAMMADEDSSTPAATPAQTPSKIGRGPAQNSAQRSSEYTPVGTSTMWQSQDPQSKLWVNYSPEHNSWLTRCYQANSRGNASIQINSNPYSVTFSDMRQTNSQGGWRAVRPPLELRS